MFGIDLTDYTDSVSASLDELASPLKDKVNRLLLHACSPVSARQVDTRNLGLPKRLEGEEKMSMRKLIGHGEKAHEDFPDAVGGLVPSWCKRDGPLGKASDFFWLCTEHAVLMKKWNERGCNDSVLTSNSDYRTVSSTIANPPEPKRKNLEGAPTAVCMASSFASRQMCTRMCLSCRCTRCTPRTRTASPRSTRTAT